MSFTTGGFMINRPPKLCIIVLVKDEDLHIDRFIGQFQNYDVEIYIIDSYSTDGSLERYRNHKQVTILANQFETQAQQFDWALNNIPDKYEWFLRLDADELVDVHNLNFLVQELSKSDSYVGASFIRKIKFQGTLLRYGNSYENNCVRLFRKGHGRSNRAIMDEKIVVDGPVLNTAQVIVDESLIGFHRWFDKHNNYSSREALNFIAASHSERLGYYQSNLTAEKWKYYRLPPYVRAFLFFSYRLIIKCGFLDGIKGITFLLMQGLLYRLMVDVKIREIEEILRANDENTQILPLLASHLGIKIGQKTH